MRSTWLYSLLLFLLCLPAFGQQKIRPDNQIAWPSFCTANPGFAYSPGTNTCVNGGIAANPAPPSFAVQFANSGLSAFQGLGGISITPTSGSNGTFNLGPVPFGSTAVTSTSYGLYSGLPTMMNVMTDCPALTGLSVSGIGNSGNDDYAAIQACIWQRIGICAVGSGLCTPTDKRFNSTSGVAGVTFIFPQRQFNTSFGQSGLSQNASYYFSQSLDVPWGVHLQGEGWGQSTNATTLQFAPGAGIYLRGFDGMEHFNVVGSSCFTTNTLATYILPTGFGGSGPAVSGISIGGSVRLNDLYVHCFDMHGIRVDSSQSWPTPNTLNESDETYIENVTSAANRGSGFYYNGTDSNVSACIRCESRSNQLYGFSVTSEYPGNFVSPLTDGNHEDLTGYTGVIPTITAVACNGTACTMTTGSSSPGVFAGSLILQSGFSDPGLNAHFTVSSVGATSYTIAYNTGGLATTPTPGSALYSLGTNVWCAAGCTTNGTLANGGGYYMGSAFFGTAVYAEGDQPIGQSSSTSTLTVYPTGVSQTMLNMPFLSVANGSILSSGLYTVPLNGNVSVQTGANFSGSPTVPVAQIFNDTSPNTLLAVNQENSTDSKILFMKTFNGNGNNAVGNKGNWWCYQRGTTAFNSFLTSSDLCLADLGVNGIADINITNGGSGYTAPVFVANGTYGGAGVVFPVIPVSGGVITTGTYPTTIAGGGYDATATCQIFDTTGSGATCTFTYVGSPPGTDPLRSNYATTTGIMWVPNALCGGSLGSWTPANCWTWGTAAPASGSWKLGDIVFNQAPTINGIYAWQNTTAGSPGTWTSISIPQGGATKFTAAGCTSITSTVGNATAGRFIIGANTCTVVITINGATGLTAPNGWSCHANDETTAGGNTGLYFSANSTTTATLTVPATAAANDHIDFACSSY